MPQAETIGVGSLSRLHWWGKRQSTAAVQDASRNKVITNFRQVLDCGSPLPFSNGVFTSGGSRAGGCWGPRRVLRAAERWPQAQARRGVHELSLRREFAGIR